MPSNPLPVNLQAECRKAAKIYSSFVDPVNGLDSLIPPSILRRAKGFCFMSVAKAGFVFSARAGSGLVIAKLPDGSWSAPSAVGTAGGGFGLQVGVEVAEFLIVLNSRKAVQSFRTKGSLTLGGNMSVAAGPLGRNIEGTGSLSAKGGVAAMYSYSRTKGLFGGASVEGSIIVERSDANSKAYGFNVTAAQLLSGGVDPPSWSLSLIDTIQRLSEPSRIPGWIDDDAEYPPSDDDSELSEDEFSGRRRAGSGAGRGGAGRRAEAERGYAFGSSYAAGGSSAMSSSSASNGRFSAMLGSVGRSRSSSNANAARDPFATPGGSSTTLVGGGEHGGARGGPAVGGEARFETQFSRLSDDDEIYLPSSSAAREKKSSSSSAGLTRPGRSGSGSSPPPLSREPSFAGSSPSKGKLTKPRSGSATSAGLRERAGQMSWGSDAREDGGFGGSGGGGSGGGGMMGGIKSRFRSSSSAAAPSPPLSTSSFGSSGGPVDAFNPSALSSSSNKPKSRLRSSTVPSKHSTKSPFDDETSTISSFSSHEAPPPPSSTSDSRLRPELNRALSKPWDSEDESYFSPPAPSFAFSSANTSSSSPPSPGAGSPRTPSAGSHAPLDLGEVEADFASVMSLAKHGGEAEVGSYSSGTGARSRSSTVTGGGTGGGRSRSGTVIGGGGAGEGGGKEGRPPGVGKGGIGWAVALYDFPGVESTDLPFLRSDLLTILARDDDEWWKARKGVREGMVPRNYLEAHFD
ncbi:hypothetical protein JCM8547_004114 [Rhodosporidiobolus lusitaniae]